jgi:hypothetical protein
VRLCVCVLRQALGSRPRSLLRDSPARCRSGLGRDPPGFAHRQLLASSSAQWRPEVASTRRSTPPVKGALCAPSAAPEQQALAAGVLPVARGMLLTKPPDRLARRSSRDPPRGDPQSRHPSRGSKPELRKDRLHGQAVKPPGPAATLSAHHQAERVPRTAGFFLSVRAARAQGLDLPKGQSGGLGD